MKRALFAVAAIVLACTATLTACKQDGPTPDPPKPDTTTLIGSICGQFQITDGYLSLNSLLIGNTSKDESSIKITKLTDSTISIEMELVNSKDSSVTLSLSGINIKGTPYNVKFDATIPNTDIVFNDRQYTNIEMTVKGQLTDLKYVKNPVAAISKDSPAPPPPPPGLDFDGELVFACRIDGKLLEITLNQIERIKPV